MSISARIFAFLDPGDGVPVGVSVRRDIGRHSPEEQIVLRGHAAVHGLGHPSVRLIAADSGFRQGVGVLVHIFHQGGLVGDGQGGIPPLGPV